jgi:hypothetical protein
VSKVKSEITASLDLQDQPANQGNLGHQVEREETEYPELRDLKDNKEKREMLEHKDLPEELEKTEFM